MVALGEAARGPGTTWFTGGATAVLLGWREATIDVDLRFDPEPPGVFEALRDLKERLAINVELAWPPDFIPVLPGWRERSLFVATHGRVDFYHYDLYAQALCKVERGHDQDRHDVRTMLARGLIAASELRLHLSSIEPALVRYPAIDPVAFRARLDEALRG
ncbi:MAG: hypothetical protein HY722_05945 [Planctomycetes bacterium]|nr:hypothetical protein [Planctomycetota bacterium]